MLPNVFILGTKRKMAIRLFARKSWADTSTRKNTRNVKLRAAVHFPSPFLKLEREPLIFHNIVPTIHPPATFHWRVVLFLSIGRDQQLVCYFMSPTSLQINNLRHSQNYKMLI